MNEKLIEGYLAYTNADEYGASAAGDAPATPPLSILISVATASAASGASVAGTFAWGC